MLESTSMKLLVLSILFVLSVVIGQAQAFFFLPIERQKPEELDILWSFGHASKKFLPNQRLKILVWNIYKGSEPTFPREFPYLAIESDLVLTQEILFDKNMENVLYFLPHFYGVMATSFLVGKEQHRTGVATLSPVKSLYNKGILTETTEPITSTSKATLISKYPIKNSNSLLTVVNIHGINFVTNTSFQYELERIKKLIENIDGPLLFAGDFNTWNQERMSSLEKMITDLKLTPAQFSPDYRKTFNGYPLDHFFYSQHFNFIKARVEKSFKGSDHQPLILEIELNHHLLN